MLILIRKIENTALKKFFPIKTKCVAMLDSWTLTRTCSYQWLAVISVNSEFHEVRGFLVGQN